MAKFNDIALNNRMVVALMQDCHANIQKAECNVYVLLENPVDHMHEQVKVEVGITRYVGFKRSQDGTLELVAERDAWDEQIPIERFLEKVTQSYARETVMQTVQEKGYSVVSEQKSVDNTIELVVEKW